MRGSDVGAASPEEQVTFACFVGGGPGVPLDQLVSPHQLLAAGPGMVSLPRLSPDLQSFVDVVITSVDNGKAPRSAYGYTRWENAKRGMFQHIPVCDTLAQLTTYFNGGAAEGSTHFGNGRDLAHWLTLGNLLVPFSDVHQYLPIVGAYSPWAQGILNSSGSCAIPWNPVLNGMSGGEINCAYLSVENVARTGTQGMTDPQFNSNVFLRAMGSAYFGYTITPSTQLWHAESDRVNRCSDPGWTGDLEDAAQAAAIAVLNGNYTLLRGVQDNTPAPVPAPVPVPVDPYRELLYSQLQDALAAANDDILRFAVRKQHYDQILASFT